LERIVTELKRTCIVVAEADVLIRNLVSTILSTEGHLILAAANNAEALELSRSFEGEIRLLICRSRELATDILGERPNVRVILLTSATSSSLKEIVRKVDPGAYLRDAVLPVKLGDLVRRALTEEDFSRTPVEI
jgi:DNA-binding NtrC family response regulator